MKKDGHGVRSALLMVSEVPPLLLITIVLARTNKNGPPADNRQRRRRRPISLSIPKLFPPLPPAPLPHIFLTTTCFSSSLSKPPSLSCHSRSFVRGGGGGGGGKNGKKKKKEKVP